MSSSNVRYKTPRVSKTQGVGLVLAKGIGLFLALTIAAMGQEADPEQRLQALGLELPPVRQPVANYVHAVQTGNLVFLAGHGPIKADGTILTGRVGDDMSIDAARDAAQLTALNLLTSLKAEIGDLNRVKRIVKVVGMVQATSDFTQHPAVINGCSDLLVEVFGERGKHARAAVGMASLPFNTPVEIEMIVEVED